MIDRYTRNVKGKACCGPDNLSTQHLIYVHPAMLLHVKLLFHLILRHKFVQNSFGYCLVIPLIKDKTGNLNAMDNYRAITLSPVISKLFEMVVLEICSDAMITDPLMCVDLIKLVYISRLFISRSIFDGNGLGNQE